MEGDRTSLEGLGFDTGTSKADSMEGDRTSLEGLGCDTGSMEGGRSVDVHEDLRKRPRRRRKNPIAKMMSLLALNACSLSYVVALSEETKTRFPNPAIFPVVGYQLCNNISFGVGGNRGFVPRKLTKLGKLLEFCGVLGQ